jgi:uncharacterized protein (UPF0332 family)
VVSQCQEGRGAVVTSEAQALWERAGQAVRSARALQSIDSDRTASTAYHAAFFAVSALFALEGKFFTKHTAVAAAVHRDLVHSGRLPPEFGESYSWLLRMRQTGDYGGETHVGPAEATEAIRRAQAVLDGVQTASDETLPDH